MDDQTDPYVIRFSASLDSLALVALSVAATVSLVRIAAETAAPPAWVLVPVAGSIAAFLVVTHLARLGKVALRVDSRGLTFGGQPFRHRETTHTVPWAAIDSVVVYRTYLYRVQGFGPRTGRFLGLRGTAGPITFPGRPDPLTDPSGYGAMIDRLRRRVPHVPPDVTYASRRVWGWPLSRDRLAEAVTRFAPRVEVVDAG